MTTVKFFVPGTAAPQGSKRALGPGRMIESSKHVGPWRERVALAAHNAMAGQPLIDGPAATFIEFVLPRPKSAPKTWTPDAVHRPDLDKLARAVLDAITGTVIRDDAQVIELHATKRLAHRGQTPGANLEIIALAAATKPCRLPTRRPPLATPLPPHQPAPENPPQRRTAALEGQP